jgi:hypothetical protein
MDKVGEYSQELSKLPPVCEDEMQCTGLGIEVALVPPLPEKIRFYLFLFNMK